jgi:hypothetical protein
MYRNYYNRIATAVSGVIAAVFRGEGEGEDEGDRRAPVRPSVQLPPGYLEAVQILRDLAKSWQARGELILRLPGRLAR